MEMNDVSGTPRPDDQVEAALQDAKELGRRGGLKGGPARAKKLSPERRSAITRKAAEVRWDYPFGAPRIH